MGTDITAYGPLFEHSHQWHLWVAHLVAGFLPQRVGAGRLIFSLSGYLGIAIATLVGPQAIPFLLVSHLLGMAIPIRVSIGTPRRGRETPQTIVQRETRAEWFHRAGSLAIAMGSQVIAIVVADTCIGLGHELRYPLPIDEAGPLGRYVLYLLALFATQTALAIPFAWALTSITDRLELAPMFRVRVHREKSNFGVALLFLGPLQVLGHIFYLQDSWWPGAAISLWATAMHVAGIQQAFARSSRQNLERESAYLRQLVHTQDNLRRIAHQIRHQLGILGMSLSRLDSESLRRHGSSSASEPVVREEIPRIQLVHSAIRDALDMLQQPSVLQQPSALRQTSDSEKPINDPHRHENSQASATLASVVSTSTRLLSLTARDLGIQLDVEPNASTDGHQTVMHATAIRQALHNIIENAIEAAQTKVSVTYRGTPNGLVICVVDDGPGISPDDLDALGTPTQTTKPEGSGLGISIAEALLQRAGGTLTFVPRLRGSCVELRFPGQQERPTR